MRIFLFTECITPYRIEFFNEIANKVGYDNFVVQLWYAEDEYHPYEIPKNSIKFQYFILSFHKSYTKSIKNIFGTQLRGSFDYAVIAGLNVFSILLFLIFKIRKTKVFQWTEEREVPKNLFRIIFRKYFLKRFNGIICVSRKSKEYIIKQYGISEEKVEVILQSPLTIKKWKGVNLNNKRIINLLYVGVLEQYKNVAFLIEALKFYYKNEINNKKLHLKIIGNGPEEEMLKNKVKHEGLSQYIECLDFISERKRLIEEYKKADIFVLPSHETFGVVLAEALMNNLVLLASSEVGSAYDILQDGVNGYIFEDNSISDFIRKLNSLLDGNLKCERNSLVLKCGEFSAINLAKKLIDVLTTKQY